MSAAEPGGALVVAHRGDSANHAENTLEAFEAAIAAGADVIEFDVRLSRDGTPVVMHDADVSRTTSGSGLVRDLSDTDILELGIPTLAEALSFLSGRAGADIEIKNVPGDPEFDPEDRLSEATVGDVRAAAFSGIVLISSFNPLSLSRVREIAPELETGLLSTDEVDARVAFEFARSQGHPWVLPFISTVVDAGRSFVDAVHSAGMRLGTWISDDPMEAVALMSLGVDAVATNDPGAILAARGEAFR